MDSGYWQFNIIYREKLLAKKKKALIKLVQTFFVKAPRKFFCGGIIYCFNLEDFVLKIE